MARDIPKVAKPLKSAQADAGGANINPVARIGVVKSTIDSIRQGRIFVYISDNSGTDPDNSDNWVPVFYLSSFYGRTQGAGGQDDTGSFLQNPISYGEWHSPPDIGTEVLCIFANGDMDFGFCLGAIPDPESMYMLPAIGATDKIIPNEGEAPNYGGAKRLPVSNINDNNPGVANKEDYVEAPKPIHSYAAAIMFQQGILRDPIRGAIGSSSQRETPSRLGWGVSTPGRPIYEGGFTDESVASNLSADNAKNLKIISRRSGHSIVMDDGDLIGRDQLIRIRTSLGHQIMMSDDGQTLSILHSNGQSYIELGKEGTVDIYSTNSFNVRSQGDINFHADNNINIHATKDLNISADNVNLNAEKAFSQKTGADYQSYTVGKHTIKSDGAMSSEAGGDISMASSSIAYVNGESKVNLNTGKTSTVPAKVKFKDPNSHPDTLFDDKGFASAPAKLVSVTSRAPAHYPWQNAGLGVDVKTNLTASANLPSSPAGPLGAANQAAASAVNSPVTTATTAGIPTPKAVGGAIDKVTTNALLGQAATNAVTGQLGAAVQQGAAVVNTAAGKVAAVGQFAQTPQQLEQAGILKAGASAVVNSLVQGGSNVASALTSNLFTGKPGAENLNALKTNVTAQATALVTNLQQSQSALTAAGIMTGKESPTAIAGAVLSGATAGVGATVSAIQGSAQNAVGALTNPAGALGAAAGAATNQLKGAVSAATQAIGSGNFAAGLADNVQKGLGSLQQSVASMSPSGAPSLDDLITKTKGIAAGAFNAIVGSFKPLQAGVPQDLTAIAAKNSAEAAATSVASAGQGALGSLAKAATGLAATAGVAALTKGVSGAAGALTSKAGSVGAAIAAAGAGAVAGGIGQLASSATSGAAGAIDKLTSAAASSPSALLSSATGSAAGLVDAAKGVASSAAASASSAIASGVSNLPGGSAVTGALVNSATGALQNASAGISKIGGLVASAQGAAMNGLKMPNLPSAESLKSFAAAGLPPGAAAGLTAALASLGSGGGAGLKLPAVALNTNDRSAITAQISSVLGSPKIPPPNLVGEISEKSISALAEESKKIREKTDQVVELSKQLKEYRKEFYAQRTKLQSLKDTLPEGDPQIETAKAELKAIFDRGQVLYDKLAATTIT